MRYLLASLVAGAFATAPAVANSEEWYHLLDRLGYLYFADAGSLSRSGEIVEVDFLQGNLDSPPPGENALLSYRVDCGKRTLRLTRGRYFADDGTQIPDLDLPGAPIPSSVDTVSPGDHFYDFACREAYREAREDDPFARIRTAREQDY